MLRANGPRADVALAIIVTVLTSCASPDRSAATAPTSSARAVSASMPMRGSTADIAPNTVWMGDHYFSPSRLTVKVGATVTWRMLGSQEHDVWSLDGSFHSPTMGPGSTYTHTFTKTGVFKYICLPHHGDGMYGEVIVL